MEGDSCLGCLLLLIGLPILIYVGYFIIGIFVWAIPFLLACGIICLIGYGIICAIGAVISSLQKKLAKNPI